MVTYSVSNLKCKVQSFPSALQLVNDAEGMFVMAEGSVVGGEGAGESFFAGMSEGGMTEVVTEGYSLGEIFVEIEGSGYCAGDLHHLQGMGQAGTEVVTIGRDEDLRFVHKTTESLGVDDAIPVALELVTDAVGGFGSHSACALFAGPGVLSQPVGSRSPQRFEPLIRAPGSTLPGACAST